MFPYNHILNPPLPSPLLLPTLGSASLTIPHLYPEQADAFDPSYQTDFYGAHFPRLSAIKETYDPEHVFYCTLCLGSEMWTQLGNGKLCMVGSASRWI